MQKIVPALFLLSSVIASSESAENYQNSRVPLLHSQAAVLERNAKDVAVNPAASQRLNALEGVAVEVGMTPTVPSAALPVTPAPDVPNALMPGKLRTVQVQVDRLAAIPGASDVEQEDAQADYEAYAAACASGTCPLPSGYGTSRLGMAYQSSAMSCSGSSTRRVGLLGRRR